MIASGCLHVVKTVKIQVTYRTSATYMRMTLISPSGTVSVLQDFESNSVRTDSTKRKQILTSVYFWDEDAFGLWRFELKSDGKINVIRKVSLTFFGTGTDMTRKNTMLKDKTCAPTCQSLPRYSDHTDIRCIIIAVVVTLSCILVIIIVVVVSCIIHKKRTKGTTLESHEMKDPSNKALIA
ncbi:uncharacterized protein LOC128553902 [Mercenaria mercenaria]|uniref:uncharacterized protein LOC128553902 n=1 Tax=Mercenaria mercenaria TaxID=6596 RepID=UPI00234F63B9|nr:uncharacterized protein LOC128553902 [Mercenaria mercenaria]